MTVAEVSRASYSLGSGDETKGLGMSLLPEGVPVKREAADSFSGCCLAVTPLYQQRTSEVQGTITLQESVAEHLKFLWSAKFDPACIGLQKFNISKNLYVLLSSSSIARLFSSASIARLHRARSWHHAAGRILERLLVAKVIV